VKPTCNLVSITHASTAKASASSGSSTRIPYLDARNWGIFAFAVLAFSFIRLRTELTVRPAYGTGGRHALADYPPK